jgi:predicted metal-dependent hydrolase
MNTDATARVEIAGLTVEIVRKAIDNLHVGVYPPMGHVRVAAPHALGEDAVKMAVLTRLPWIKRKRAEFRKQPRQGPREYVSGETHYVFGRACKLTLAVGRPRLEMQPDNRLAMTSAAGAGIEDREAQMYRWYRRLLRGKAEPRLSKWSARLGIPVPGWGIRRMKTKWGSCNPGTGRVWVNLELAKKPLHCLDYVILHELAHFVSPRHDDRFIATLDRNMPGWRQARSDLNALPLAHEPGFEGRPAPEDRLVPEE